MIIPIFGLTQRELDQSLSEHEERMVGSKTYYIDKEIEYFTEEGYEYIPKQINMNLVFTGSVPTKTEGEIKPRKVKHKCTIRHWYKKTWNKYQGINKMEFMYEERL